MKKKFTWVVTDGKAGMIAQARGLAEAVGLPIIDKIIVPSLPWRWLPAGLWSHSFLDGIVGAPKIGNPMAPPWPDLLVSCGRNAVGPALAVKRNSHGHTLIVHVQHPHVNPARFDIVAAPAHDNLSGANVMTIQGALHRATPERLAAAAKEVASTVSHLSRPLVAVLIGGSNRSYLLTPQTISKLADNLVKLTREHDVGLMVTPSRRTGSNNEEILRQKLAALPAVIWDKMGDNPYYGYLGLADAIIVTPDSVNMVSEACSTGKPVYIAEMEGSDKKFERFHQALFDAGMTRPFVGALEAWQYTALDDITPVAIAVRRRLNLA